MPRSVIDSSDVPWGGKRPGSGRKPDAEGKRELIAARVSPATARKLKAEAKKKGMPIGRVIDDWARRR